mgnify:CR=1 FL=1
MRLNLNTLIDHKESKTINNITVVFDNIVHALCKKILRKQTVYVVGCSAWLSNKKILSCLNRKKGCSIIITNDRKMLRSKKLRKLYGKLPQFQPPHKAINVIGTVGKKQSLMHNKFLIGLSETKDPIWVVTGSFNLTESAVYHLENCIIIDDSAVALLYMREFCELYKISRPL